MCKDIALIESPLCSCNTFLPLVACTGGNRQVADDQEILTTVREMGRKI